MGRYIEDDAWPDTMKDQALKDLFETFMNLSNAPNSTHHGEPEEEKLADLFVDDGTYTLASKSATGKKNIIAMRKALFAHIPEREHCILKYYTFGSDNLNIVGHGTVGYKHHHGHETGTDWMAKYTVKNVGGKLKFASMQIVMDTAHHV